MNKYKQLTKKIAKVAITAAIVIGAVGAVYAGLSIYADTVTKQRKEHEDKLAAENTQLSNLRSRMDKSGEAEKRYIAIQTERSNQDVASNRYDKGGLVEFLQAAAERYRFSKPTSNLNKMKEIPTEKQELASFGDYNVLVTPGIELNFKAVSDTHVFSFIDELRRDAPGLVRIDKLDIKRLSDMADATVTQMQTGSTPILVDATVAFTWIRITPKEDKNAKPGAATAAAAPAQPGQ